MALFLKNTDRFDNFEDKPVVVGWGDAYYKKFSQKGAPVRAIKPSFKLSITKNNLKGAKNIFLPDAGNYGNWAYSAWWDTELAYDYKKISIYDYEFRINEDGSVTYEKKYGSFYLPYATSPNHTYLRQYIE